MVALSNRGLDRKGACKVAEWGISAGESSSCFIGHVRPDAVTTPTREWFVGDRAPGDNLDRSRLFRF